MAVAATALAVNPKREFRGAWMHTIGQMQYSEQTTEQNKAYIRDQFDKLQKAGVNAVLFQVRPSADAFYPSKYEPWSKYLTKDGKAPSPYWDPLAFVIEEAHNRGMELHAWLNPYRVTTSKTDVPAPGHIYHKHPERFVRYADGKIYFDPALPENREFIAKVVMDIVDNYDVDGIHFDDYFYPYPVAGKDFPDAKSYAKYGKGKNKGNWRRHNVDLLIELVSKRIRQSDKPWIRFGISPFGIWRNKKSDPRGSNTSGLQNYDDLYADVLLWAENGWIDYLLPQLYWEIEHPRAGYIELIDWWAKAVTPNCHLYIGQDVERTMEKRDIDPYNSPTQLDHKMRLARENENIKGNCWWPGYSITKNSKGVADSLAYRLQASIALPPSYATNFEDFYTETPKNFRYKDGNLMWDAPKAQGLSCDVSKYVIYRFDDELSRDYDNPWTIVAVTPATSFKVPSAGFYSVTALNKVNNESEPTKIICVE